MSVLRMPSQAEAEEFQKFCEANNIVKDENSATRLGEPILTTGQPITQSTLKAVFAAVRGQLTYLPIKSQAEQEYDQVAALFSTPQLEAFNAIYAKQRLVQGNSDEAFENKTALLGQLRGRPINQQTFLEALGRIANNATRRLHILPEPVAESFGRHSNAHFEVQESVKLSVDGDQKWDSESKFAAGGRINHAHKPETKTAKPSTPIQDHQRRALAVRGDTHAENQVLSKIFVTYLGLRMNAYSDQVDWNQTATAREAALKEMVRTKERGC